MRLAGTLTGLYDLHVGILLRYTGWCAVMIRIGNLGGACLCIACLAGCGEILAPAPPPLFSVPLAIEGESIGPGVIDTGGGFELMLREPFGLRVVDSTEVLAFGGTESVDVTEGFDYTAGGWQTHADAAIVGVSVCECNGLGFHFFRKTGAVLALDFENLTASFHGVVPAGGVKIRFAPPPPQLPDFFSSFVEVEVAADGESRTVPGLLDSGSTSTVMRRGLVGPSSGTSSDRLNITVGEVHLGTVAVQVGLFDTPGLPDIILGTDVMGVWSDRWYFSFTPEGGTVTVFPRFESTTPPVATLSRTTPKVSPQ